MGRSGTRPSRERRRPAGGAATARQLAVETTALPGAAREDARPTDTQFPKAEIRRPKPEWPYFASSAAEVNHRLDVFVAQGRSNVPCNFWSRF